MIRLQDIAEMAGVSRTTVSNVINEIPKEFPRKRLIRLQRSLKNRIMFRIWDQ